MILISSLNYDSPKVMISWGLNVIRNLATTKVLFFPRANPQSVTICVIHGDKTGHFASQIRRFSRSYLNSRFYRNSFFCRRWLPNQVVLSYCLFSMFFLMCNHTAPRKAPNMHGKLKQSFLVAFHSQYLQGKLLLPMEFAKFSWWTVTTLWP